MTDLRVGQQVRLWSQVKATQPFGLIWRWWSQAVTDRVEFFTPISGGCRKHNFWTAHFKSTKNYIFGILSSRSVDWYMYGSNRRGSGGCPSFMPPLQKITRPLLQNFKYIIGILSSSPVDWHPFWTNWVKGGVCGHVQKSETHELGCRPRGESSQWNSNQPQTYRIVPAWDSGILKK